MLGINEAGIYFFALFESQQEGSEVDEAEDGKFIWNLQDLESLLTSTEPLSRAVSDET